MVSNESRELVLEVMNTQLEFQTKIFVFIVLLLYFLFSFYLSYRILPSGAKISSVRISELMFAAWLRILSVIFLFFYPLYTIVFLFSGVALEQIMGYMFFAYGIFGILIGVFGFIFGFERLLEMFGLNFFRKSRRGNMRRGRR